MILASRGRLPDPLVPSQPHFLPLRIFAPPRVGKSATALMTASLAKRLGMLCLYSVAPYKVQPIFVVDTENCNESDGLPARIQHEAEIQRRKRDSKSLQSFRRHRNLALPTKRKAKDTTLTQKWADCKSSMTNFGKGCRHERRTNLNNLALRLRQVKKRKTPSKTTKRKSCQTSRM